MNYANLMQNSFWPFLRREGGRQDSPAGLAHFTLGALPARPLDGRGSDLQAGSVVVLPTTRTEKQVQAIARCVADRTPRLLARWNTELSYG